MSSAPRLLLRAHDAAGMQDHHAALIAVYREVYAELLDDPFFDPARFWERLESYAKWPGFRLVTAWLDAELVGYTLGYTLPNRSNWWRGLRDKISPSLLVEDGKRTFAVTQLMVRPQWRRRGYARSLHDNLLSERPEERATLLVKPDNVPARTAYLSWGWQHFGQVRPFDDAPVYDALMFELAANSDSVEGA